MGKRKVPKKRAQNPSSNAKKSKPTTPPVPSRSKITLKLTTLSSQTVLEEQDEELEEDSVDELSEPEATPAPEPVVAAKAKAKKPAISPAPASVRAASTDAEDVVAEKPEFVCTVEFIIYLDKNKVSVRTRAVNLYDQEGRWGYIQYKYWAKECASEEAKKAGELARPATKWDCFYGALSNRHEFEIRGLDDWAEFEKILITTKTKSALINARFGVVFDPDKIPAPSPPAKATRAKPEKVVQHVLSEDEGIDFKKRGQSTTTSKMKADLSATRKAEEGTISATARLIKTRWECMIPESCENKGSACCWIDGKGVHYRLKENDVSLWARAVFGKAESGAKIDDPPLDVKADLLKRRRFDLDKAAKIETPVPAITPPTLQLPYGVTPHLTYDSYTQPYRTDPSPRPYYPSSDNSFYREMIESGDMMRTYYGPERYAPRGSADMRRFQYDRETDWQRQERLSRRRSPSSPPRRRSRSPSAKPSRQTDSFDFNSIRESSPIQDNIELDDVVQSFQSWLQRVLPINRRAQIPKFIQAIAQEAWSLEQFRTLSAAELERKQLPSGPFHVIKDQVTPFKAWFKVENPPVRPPSPSITLPYLASSPPLPTSRLYDSDGILKGYTQVNAKPRVPDTYFLDEIEDYLFADPEGEIMVEGQSEFDMEDEAEN